jgi:hypothetical protein
MYVTHSQFKAEKILIQVGFDHMTINTKMQHANPGAEL